MSTWDKYGLVLVALIVTPFLLPGFTAGRERGILRRDESYPGFIRAWGTAHRAAEPSATIKALRGIDFGFNKPIASLKVAS